LEDFILKLLRELFSNVVDLILINLDVPLECFKTVNLFR